VTPWWLALELRLALGVPVLGEVGHHVVAVEHHMASSPMALARTGLPAG
jgi:hypothetical protein